MLEKFLSYFKAQNIQDVNMGWPRAIAFHLAKNYLFERGDVDSLYPDFKDKCLQLISSMQARNMPIQLVGAIRTAKYQDTLYEKVPQVTTVRGLQSYHNYGLAADFDFVNYGYNPPAGYWEAYGEEANKLGLIWGGDFPKIFGGTFVDMPHVEWHPNFTHSDLEPYFKV